jgi:hypothetical protein
MLSKCEADGIRNSLTGADLRRIPRGGIIRPVINYPLLRSTISASPTLPQHIKAAIMALVSAGGCHVAE